MSWESKLTSLDFGFGQPQPQKPLNNGSFNNTQQQQYKQQPKASNDPFSMFGQQNNPPPQQKKEDIDDFMGFIWVSKERLYKKLINPYSVKI